MKIFESVASNLPAHSNEYMPHVTTLVMINQINHVLCGPKVYCKSVFFLSFSIAFSVDL